ncbi:hypothetical protein OXV71_19080 [Bacteroides fragilis]|jgi:hypothetical protein|uniref:hypothetical protein n=1 Tax=Bacteroides fragilis TaxID=817 RepID=UPI0002808ED7|nr:hypothetical protein [Bacteroides fragilis]EKA87626.1 hypothetical protein HMPREF1203_04633 [Bacteroides fragilis HMW 610]MCY6352841.1 hypothetical protein [Bacteroides fragilis]
MYRKKNSRFIQENDIIVFNVLKPDGPKKVLGSFFEDRNIQYGIETDNSLMKVIELSTGTMVISAEIKDTPRSIIIQDLKIKVRAIRTEELLRAIDAMNIILAENKVILPVNEHITSIEYTEVEYKVYNRYGSDIPIVSLDQLTTQHSVKRKFVGKKAKIEAIKRSFGVELSLDLTTDDVNEYIAKNIFNTPRWREYHRTFKEVANEKEMVNTRMEFKYSLIVQFRDMNLSFDDERVLHFIICALIDSPQDTYQGLVNPIISIQKVL